VILATEIHGRIAGVGLRGSFGLGHFLAGRWFFERKFLVQPKVQVLELRQLVLGLLFGSRGGRRELLGLFLDVLDLELPRRPVAIAVKLATIHHGADLVRADSETFSRFFHTVILLGHEDLPVQQDRISGLPASAVRAARPPVSYFSSHFCCRLIVPQGCSPADETGSMHDKSAPPP